jgi:hypothetical protein
MSTDINVFIEDNRMIKPSEWQSQLDAADFPLELDSDFDPRDFFGFLPCKMAGETVGFEYSLDPLEDTMFDPEEDPQLTDIIGTRSICVGFRIPAGDPEQHIIAAVMAAAALARATEGVLWLDPDFIETDDPIQWARKAIGS